MIITIELAGNKEEEYKGASKGVQMKRESE